MRVKRTPFRRTAIVTPNTVYVPRLEPKRVIYVVPPPKTVLLVALAYAFLLASLSQHWYLLSAVFWPTIVTLVWISNHNSSRRAVLATKYTLEKVIEIWREHRSTDDAVAGNLKGWVRAYLLVAGLGFVVLVFVRASLPFFVAYFLTVLILSYLSVFLRS